MQGNNKIGSKPIEVQAKMKKKDEDETKSGDTAVRYDLLRTVNGVGDSELNLALSWQGIAVARIKIGL